MATTFPDTSDSSTAPDPSIGWVAGDEFVTTEGVTYTWTGYSWTTEGSGGGSEYLPLTGGALTGPLTSTSSITAAGAIESGAISFNKKLFPSSGTNLECFYDIQSGIPVGGIIQAYDRDNNNLEPLQVRGSTWALNLDGSITAAGKIQTEGTSSVFIGSNYTGSDPAANISNFVGSYNGAANFYVRADGSITAANRITMGSSTNRGQFKGICPNSITASAANFIDAQYDGTSVIEMKYDGSISAAGQIKVEGPSTPQGRSSRINKYGSLLIGTTSDAVGGARCSINSSNGGITTDGNLVLGSSSLITLRGDNGTITASGEAKFGGSVDVSSSTAYGTKIEAAANAGNIIVQCQGTASSFTELYRAYKGATKVFAVAASGNATFIGSVTASNVSDIRFKENITDANPQLADAVALGSQLKNFDWNDDAPLNEELRAKRFLGLVAQEAEKVCPGLTYTVPRTKQGAELTAEVVVPAVYETKTVPAVLDDEGKVIEEETTEQVLVTEEQVTPATYEELDDSYKAINHDILVMKLLGAVAELKAEVEALKAVDS